MKSRPDLAPILFVVTADPQQTKDFFQKRWLEARAVSDEQGDLYQAFELERGSSGQMFGVRSLLSGAKATLKGHTIGLPTGDPWRLGGFFIVDSGLQVLWEYRAKHAGDHADLDELQGAFREAEALLERSRSEQSAKDPYG